MIDLSVMGERTEKSDQSARHREETGIISRITRSASGRT